MDAEKIVGEQYHFTRAQLCNVMYGTIEMFLEYRDKHGKAESDAPVDAVNEMLEGLDAEIELFFTGELSQLTLQLLA